MKRWGIGLLLVIVAAIYLWHKPSDSELNVLPIKQMVHHSPSKAPAIPMVMAPIATRRPAGMTNLSKLAAVKLPAEQRVIDSQQAILEQNGRQWRYLEGVRAVAAGDPRVAHLHHIAESVGFWILTEGDIPADVTSYGLVERTDNGLIGVFTGVLKSMGKPHLRDAEQFLSECPCQVAEAYPALNSYLLRAPSGTVNDDFKRCLQATGLFKRLEWEILDRPQINR